MLSINNEYNSTNRKEYKKRYSNAVYLVKENAQFIFLYNS